MTHISSEEKISQVFRAISSPNRIKILTAIGEGEACVCHLEAVLDLRQAYISQQLMEMRDADLVDTRREGRYIFYRLTEPQLIEILMETGKLFGISTRELAKLVNTDPLPQCCCPDCVSLLNPILSNEAEINE